MNRPCSRYALMLSLVLALVLIPALASASAPDSNLVGSRIDPAVQTDLASAGRADVLVLLASDVDLSPAYALPDKTARGQWVYDTLRASVLRTQAPLIRELEQSGAPYRRFWAVNAVQTTLDAASLQRVAALPAVQSIVSDSPITLLPPHEADLSAASTDAIPWGVQRVQAPWAWEQGITGKGVVVGGQDTGYDWQHPALIHSFRGYDAETAQASFNYNWHDGIHDAISSSGSSNVCGFNSPEPCDDHGHGTHTMGTMTGNNLDPTSADWPAAAPEAIGVAPGAEWIACRNMDRGVGRPSTYIECFEWFIAPYPFGGDPFTDGDAMKAPDVINNSWACPASEGCTNDKLDLIEPAIDAADAAGIVVVASAGNEGPSCGSVINPPAIYPRTFAAGATSSNDALASFSSRGPATYNGVEYAKPNVSAPGVSVRSAIPGGSYANFSGTSMAAPHTSGVVALLLEADPDLRGDTERIKAIISATADPIQDFLCGADSDGSPNNQFGWGIVNARRAIESLQQQGFIAGGVTNWMGQPLKGALVRAYNSDGVLVGSATADFLGGYNITLEAGDYDLTVIRFGYLDGSAADVQVVGGQTTQQDFVLNALREYLPMIVR